MAAATVSQPVDLRRRDLRERSDLIVERAELLLPQDRALLRSVFADGMDAMEVSRLQGANPRTVRRRIRQLVERVLSSEFEFVMRSRDRWPASRRRVATAHVLQGRTLREAAGHLRVSLYTVRAHMAAVRTLMLEEGV